MAQIVGWHVSACTRQRRLCAIRPGEIEGRGQITAHRAAPRGDVRLRQTVTLFDELNDRGVIEHLRTHKAAFAPWRYRDHRHAWTQTVRTGGVIDIAGEDFVSSGNSRLALRIAGRYAGRHGVIEEAVV